MEFTKEYNLVTGLTNGIRTHWTTIFFIDDDFINGYRTINSKLYKLRIPLEVDESFSNVLSKIDKLTMIDNNLFIDLHEIANRVATEDSEKLCE